jgi:hypothetical protein
VGGGGVDRPFPAAAPQPILPGSSKRDAGHLLERMRCGISDGRKTTGDGVSLRAGLEAPAGGARVSRRPAGRWPLSAGWARGVIALGDVATGLVAVGGVAIGLFSVGGIAVGLVALGAVAVGLMAVGAVAIGLVAAGALAIGLTARARSRSGCSWVRGRRMGSRRRGTCMPRMGARAEVWSGL